MRLCEYFASSRTHEKIHKKIAAADSISYCSECNVYIELYVFIGQRRTAFYYYFSFRWIWHLGLLIFFSDRLNAYFEVENDEAEKMLRFCLRLHSFVSWPPIVQSWNILFEWNLIVCRSWKNYDFWFVYIVAQEIGIDQFMCRSEIGPPLLQPET